MKKNKNIIAILAIILILSIGVTAETYVLGDNSSAKVAGTITKVSTPEQSKVLTPKWAEETTFVLENMGTNIAEGKTITADSFNDVYEAINATDGKVETYWEGKAKAYPNNLTIDLGTLSKVTTVRLRLNPDKIWGKRVQTFTILGSLDGSNFKELVPSTNHQFDPKTGNQVTIKLTDIADARFIKAQFTENTGAVGGQVAEFEVYAEN